MIVKCTMLIQQLTNSSNPNAAKHRLAGWSESVYDESATDRATVSNFRALCQKRAAMLPIGGIIVGQRYQRIDTAAQSQTDVEQFPGSSNLACDLPSTSLFCKVLGGGKNFRPTYFRGIPDTACVEGEFVRGGTIEQALNAYQTELQGYSFKGQDLNLPYIPIVSVVGTTKLVTSIAAHGLIVGDMVKLKNVEITGGKVNAVYRVTTVPSAMTFTISANPGFDGLNGFLRKATIVYIEIVKAPNIAIGRIVTKKVGRPFEQFVGRKPKR